MSESATIPPALNKAMKFILQSPLHGMISKSILLISFSGRKSGRTYTTPVSYSLSGDQVYIFTHANWWRNLNDATPITLRIQGKERQGYPQMVSADKQAIAAGLAAHLRMVPSDARWYHVTLDENGNPDAAQVEKAAETVVMIRVQLC